ncbi:MAG: hypothetical protein K1X89_06530 [Myxococcaceae bacterium]|nr:hypothetical protein [Myxococcaceae bacterium]
MGYAQHFRHQLPVIAALGRTVVSALRTPPGQAPQTPGPERHATLPPRPAALVKDYLRHVGGDPAAYPGVIPPHFFPQWGFPLSAQALVGLPYPMAKVLNGGCRLEMHRPLPANEPLEVTARLEKIDDDGRRAVIHTSVVTGTASAPRAVVAHLQAVVPLKPKDRSAPPKEPVRVPEDALELVRWRLRADAGLQFAQLTGDFNPVHWVKPYAKAFGFRSTILHGFSTLARAFEGLTAYRLAGRPERLETLDVRFTRPLVLPQEVGLFVRGTSLWVGGARGGPAALAGTFTTKELQ